MTDSVEFCSFCKDITCLVYKVSFALFLTGENLELPLRTKLLSSLSCMLTQHRTIASFSRDLQTFCNLNTEHVTACYRTGPGGCCM